MKRLTVISFGLVIGLLLASCGPKATPTPTLPTAIPKPKSYVIGHIDPLTGDTAVFGTDGSEGMQVALKEINDAGGVNGVPLELATEDNRCSAADTLTAFQTLYSRYKMPVVVGPVCSGNHLALAPETLKAKVVQVAYQSSSPRLKTIEGGHFFNTCFSDDQAAGRWIEFYEQTGKRPFAILYIDKQFGAGFKDEFVRQFEEKGYNKADMRLIQPIMAGSKDFRTELLKVQEAAPEVIFSVCEYTEAGLIRRQAQELGIKAVWVGEATVSEQVFLDLAGDAAEGYIALTMATEPEYYARYAELFRKMYGREPGRWGVYGYDVIHLVAKAIEIGGYSFEGIRQGMWKAAETYVGPSGAKKFDQWGISSGKMDWVIVKDGKFVNYQPY